MENVPKYNQFTTQKLINGEAGFISTLIFPKGVLFIINVATLSLKINTNRAISEVIPLVKRLFVEISL